MKLDEMHAELASHKDFKKEKIKSEYFLNGFGVLLLFYCKLNSIEQCWAQAKRFP